MTKTFIGYARCSTDKQDLSAQRSALLELGVAADRIYTDHGLTGTNRSRPGLDQALAAVRLGDTLVVPKLDRLARSVPDARDIADSLIARGVKLALGTNELRVSAARSRSRNPVGRTRSVGVAVMEISLGAQGVHAENAAPSVTYFSSGLSHRCLARRSRGDRQRYHHQKRCARLCRRQAVAVACRSTR
jgi:hypothetical protein